MNDHLEPIFNILLPLLERHGIDYWVYGGIAAASLSGKFLRRNDDVDIFVKDDGFTDTVKLLNSMKDKYNYKTKLHPLPNSTNRPKLDVYFNGKELMSVIPVYVEGKKVKVSFWRNSKEYSIELLNKVEREVSGYRFITPQEQFIKEFMSSYLSIRKDKIKDPNTKVDIDALFSNEEQNELEINS